MTDRQALVRIRWRRATNAWTYITWPLRRRLDKLPAHAAPTYTKGIDADGWTVESRGPSGVVVRASTGDSDN